MKETATLFIISLTIFLLIDVIWLSLTVKSLYKPFLGDMINDKPVIWAAFLFYIIYIVGLTLLVLRPAYINDSLSQAFVTGIIFGMVAYSTYNLTNMAIIKNWSVNIVWIDIMWGSFLTGISSISTIYLAKLFFSNS